MTDQRQDFGQTATAQGSELSKTAQGSETVETPQEGEVAETAQGSEVVETTQEGEAQGVRRRSFLKWGLGLTGGALVVGVGVVYPNRWGLIMKAMNYMAFKDFEPSAFIVIPASGKVQLLCPRSEMGQGVRTALSMILADELEVNLDEIEVIQAQADTKYGNQNTDGSTSVREFYLRFRNAAAGTREVLERSAAAEWGVPYKQCVAEDGKVKHLRSKRVATYQSLAAAASKMQLPSNPKLKSFREFRYIGRPRAGVDVDAMATGRAAFGADIILPHMVYACAQRAPIPGAKLKRFDSGEAKKISGVLDVVTLDDYGQSAQNNAAVCVIARHTWAAIQGTKALKIEWDTSGLTMQSSDTFRKEMLAGLDKKTTVYRKVGNVARAEKDAVKVVEASYYTPFLAHAPMEPMAAIARFSQGTCEVWAPTQDPVRAQGAIAKALGINAKHVTVNVTFLGGGFGRKAQPDFLVEAAVLSQKVGKPVRMQWTREDEIKHGFYHAIAVQRLKASVDAQGMPVSWRHQAAHPSLLNIMMPGQTKPAVFEMGMGALTMPYDIPNLLMEVGESVTPVRIGWLRSVCSLFQAFAINGFLDELAEQASIDPIQYRLRLLGKPRVIPSLFMEDYQLNTGRMVEVMNTVRDSFGWSKPLPKGHGKGFANHYSFFSYVAVAMEASCKNDVIKVHRVVCAIDCGIAVNPDSVKAQMEGAVVFGLSAALYGNITIKDSVVEQSNFHDYPLLRAHEMPKVEVHIINGDPRHPTGVGEPGVPPIAPALAAAIYDATQKRLREMPFADKLAS